MPLTEKQLRFLEQIALRIPVLIGAIGQGNLKSEYTLGVRRIGSRLVRLKMVAEVVDAGANPLQTHSLSRAATCHDQSHSVDKRPGDAFGTDVEKPQPELAKQLPESSTHADIPDFSPASKRRRPRKR
jgi:hypothetical protein